MDTLQNFYIYKEARMDNQITDKDTMKQNILFDKIIRINSGRGHPAQQTPCAWHWSCSAASQFAGRKDNQQHRWNSRIQGVKIHVLLHHILANDSTIKLTHTHIFQIPMLNKNRTTLSTKRKRQILEHNLPTTSVINSGNKCTAEDAN